MATPLQALRDAFRAHGDQHVGLLAEFTDPGALLGAVKALRKQGYTRLDTFTPFPVHGMDRAMGLGPSLLGYIVFGMAMLGLLSGVLLQWWTSEVQYPINISNKPLFAVEYGVPIMFELTILFSALGAVAGMLALNALPKPYNPLFYSERFARASDDGFFLHVQRRDGQFDQGRTAGALLDAGAVAVEYVDHEGAHPAGRDGQVPVPALAVGNGGPAAPPHTTGAL